MYRRFQNRFGTAGVIVAVVALIAALGGTALAASGALTGKQKKEVEKIAKKYAGKDGAPGTNGTNGTNGKDGAPGAAGKEGAAGAAGKNGTDGQDGADGKSVVETPIAVGNPAKCEKRGGATYEVEESGDETDVCNGKEGSPWTDGGTLPPGATETGVWTLSGTSDNTKGIEVPLSFPIQLSKELLPAQVHYETEGGFGTFCPGQPYEPKANPGQLCVYLTIGESFPSGATFEKICPAGWEINTTCFTNGETGASEVGAILVFSTPTAGQVASGNGTFAVQAPAAP